MSQGESLMLLKKIEVILPAYSYMDQYLQKQPDLCLLWNVFYEMSF